MSTPLDTAALDTLFNDVCTYSYWQAKPVDNALLEQLYVLTALDPASANCSPARFVFMTSAQGKAKLKPALFSGNLEKTMSAPVTVIVARDRGFYEQLPALFPQADARSWFSGSLRTQVFQSRPLTIFHPLHGAGAEFRSLSVSRLADKNRFCCRRSLMKYPSPVQTLSQPV